MPGESRHLQPKEMGMQKFTEFYTKYGKPVVDPIIGFASANPASLAVVVVVSFTVGALVF
jgi:hypothetical protein